MRLFYLTLLVSIFTASGCRTFGYSQLSQIERENASLIPSSYVSEYVAKPDVFDRDRFCWKIIGDEKLYSLIQKALVNNYDIKILAARLDQIRAKFEKEIGNIRPEVNYDATGQQMETKEKTALSEVRNENYYWNFSLTVLYNVDVWGRMSALVRSKAHALIAAENDLQDKILEITFQLAETWVDLIAAQQKKQLLDQQIETNTIQFELQKKRFINGTATGLDVSQQRETLSEALAQVPLIEKEISFLNHLISFLTATPFFQSIQVETNEVPDTIPLPDLGIPADLLSNRSDVRAARMRLLSSQWALESAKKNLMPSITLSANALFSHGSLDFLFQNWIGTLSASLVGSLLDGGVKKATVKQNQAIVNEKVAIYASTVSKAMMEVEDNLVALDKQKEYLSRLKENMDILHLTLKNARLQYLNGQSDFINYLTAQIAVQRLERQIINEKALLIKQSIKLYRALGWGYPLVSEQPKKGAL